MRAQVPAVYKITCLINDRCYIGSSKDTYKRWVKQWVKHLSELKLGKHPSKVMSNDFAEFGSSQFKLEVLEIVLQAANLEVREQHWLDSVPIHLRYNISTKAGHANGWKHTTESLEKMKKASTGKVLTDDHKRKIGASVKGNNLGNSYAVGNKANTGREVSIETRKKLGEISKASWTPERKEVFKAYMAKSRAARAEMLRDLQTESTTTI